MSKCKQEPYDFSLFQGDDHAFSVFYKDPAGAPINMTGYSAEMMARLEYESEDTVLELSVGDGLTITAIEGKILVEITDLQSSDIEPGIYVYDLEITDSAGKKKKLIFGKMTIRPEVTR